MAGKRYESGASQRLRKTNSTHSMKPMKLVKANATTKFDETVEIAMNLGC